MELPELPEKRDHSIPMVEQLPARYVPVFTKGCVDATLRGVPVRMQGAVEREDGRRELYRVAFIAVRAEPKRLQRLAVGAFNCPVAERPGSLTLGADRGAARRLRSSSSVVCGLAGGGGAGPIGPNFVRMAGSTHNAGRERIAIGLDLQGLTGGESPAFPTGLSPFRL
jgi:hypothetical protein